VFKLMLPLATKQCQIDVIEAKTNSKSANNIETYFCWCL